MQQLKSISPQWEAKGGKIRPRNKYKKDGILWNNYIEFEETAKHHTFDTNAPDGIYKVEELNEPAWQVYALYRGGWYKAISQPDTDKEGFESFANYMLPAATRQYVTLKEQQ